MLITLIYLLFSNASTLKRDKSILYYRIVVKELIFSSIISFSSFYTPLSESDVEVRSKFFNITTFIYIFIYGFPTVITSLTQTYFVGVYKKKIISFNPGNIIINESFSSAILVITLLFIYMPKQWFNIVSILHKQWNNTC